MEQVRFRRDRLSGYAGITKPCRIIGQRHFLIGAIAADKTVNPYTGCGRPGGQARSTQDLATINRHPQPRRVYLCDRRMVTALSNFLKELNVSAGTPKTADKTVGGSLLKDSPTPMLSLSSGALVFWMISTSRFPVPRFSK